MWSSSNMWVLERADRPRAKRPPCESTGAESIGGESTGPGATATPQGRNTSILLSTSHRQIGQQLSASSSQQWLQRARCLQGMHTTVGDRSKHTTHDANLVPVSRAAFRGGACLL